jgi:hypothetical protein
VAAASALPDGVTINPVTGVVSGTPTINALDSNKQLAKVYTIKFTIMDSSTPPKLVEVTYKITVPGLPALEVATSTLPSGTATVAYAGATLTLTTGKTGQGASTWDISAGALPAGLTLSAAGAISGTPSNVVGEVANFTVRATDSVGQTATKALSIQIAMAPNLVPTISNLAATGTSGTITVMFDCADADSDDITSRILEYSVNGGTSFAPLTAFTWTTPATLPSAPATGYSFTWDTTVAGDDVGQSAAVTTVQVRVSISDALHLANPAVATTTSFTVDNSPVLNAAETTIIANSQKVTKGTQITVMLRIVLGTGHAIAAIQCDLGYDPAVMTPAIPTGGAAEVDLVNPPQPNNKDGNAAGSVQANTPSAGLTAYRMLTFGGTTLFVTGDLFAVTFDILPGAASGTHTLTVTGIEAAAVDSSTISPVAGVAGAVVVQ